MYKVGLKVFLEARTISAGDNTPPCTLELQGEISNCQYNTELRAYIFTRGSGLWMLKDVGEAGAVVLEERRLEVFGGDIGVCRGEGNIVVGCTEEEIWVYYVDAKEKEVLVGIEEVLGRYCGERGGKRGVKVLEYKNEVVLVGFDGVPVLFHWNVGGEKGRWKEIGFSSGNLVGIMGVLMDLSGGTVVLVTEHGEGGGGEEGDELAIAEGGTGVSRAHSLPICAPARTYLKASLLHLTILNTIYSLSPLPFTPLPSIPTILTSPCSPSYLLHTPKRIITPTFTYPTEDSLSSALHPTALFLAIGYKDSFKVFAIVSSTLYNTNGGSPLKDCTALCYSPHGEHLAVAAGNSVYVFNSYSYEKVGLVQGQNGGGGIRELGYDGDRLVSKQRNGNCYVYSSGEGYAREIAFYPRDFLKTAEKHLALECL